LRDEIGELGMAQRLDRGGDVDLCDVPAGHASLPL
jgi:hypothetical protein